MGNTWTLGLDGKELYSAQPRQNLFHEAEADEVLYGGAAGGGKSKAIILDAIGFANKNPGVVVGIFRRTSPELKRSLIRELQKTLPKNSYNYNKSDRTVAFGNGSMIEFNYCEYEDDVFQYQSAEYDRLYFDELTHFTLFQYTYLLSRLRTTKLNIRTQVKSGTNPGNVGHGWVKQRFIEGKEPEKVTQQEDTETGRRFTTVFIPAKLKDNKFINEQYEQNLLGLPELERQALLEGNWDVFKGQAFSELRRDKHLCDWFEIPPDWKMFGAFDWGFNHPFSFGLFAVEPDGMVYLVKRAKGRLMRPDEIARVIIDVCGGSTSRLAYIAAGEDCWNPRMERTQPSIYELFMRNSPPIMLQKAATARVAGVQQMRKFFAWKGTTADKDGNIIDGVPMFKIFKEYSEVYENLVNMVFDPNNTEDVLKTDADENGKGGDDDYDMVRYALMSRPRPMPRLVAKPAEHSVLAYIRKKQRERSNREALYGY